MSRRALSLNIHSCHKSRYPPPFAMDLLVLWNCSPNAAGYPTRCGAVMSLSKLFENSSFPSGWMTLNRRSSDSYKPFTQQAIDLVWLQPDWLSLWHSPWLTWSHQTRVRRYVAWSLFFFAYGASCWNILHHAHFSLLSTSFKHLLSKDAKAHTSTHYKLDNVCRTIRRICVFISYDLVSMQLMWSLGSLYDQQLEANIMMRW